MIVTITPLYAGLLGLLIIVLAGLVVRQRWRHQVGLGDGGQETLGRAIRVHANSIENVPLALLLLLLAELTGTPALVLHVAGITLLIARLLHAWGLTRGSGSSFGRFWGTLVTWVLIVLLSLANVVHALIGMS